MKTKTILIIVASALLAVTAYAGVMCRTCKGTGWRTPISKCTICGGDGEVGN